MAIAILFVLCSQGSMIRDYLASYDFNLPLDDAAVDPELPLVRRRLASLAASEGLNGGYYEAQELAETFLDAAREANAEIAENDSPARVRLRDILDRDLDYQRELFEEVCDLPLAEAAAHLVWLTDLMKRRVDMAPVISTALDRQA
ncbi:hypothetical protein [Sphingomonas melonis]|uniref:hypothetical protein n=1 Tax=Sphingomonas melonis TaxID=152682 RepID=UPI001E4E6A9B|nr:hypothetical protein [Sphingomonas melonis]|tara:strand:+ start:2238 stop:2675 length:438 start_codon:yes stop_codon:yes gene_type:complete